MNRTRLAGVCAATAAAAVAALGAAAPANAQSRPTITMSGSTSVYPLANLLAREYVRQRPNRVRFRLAQGGSDVGIADVAAGRVTAGMSSSDPKATNPRGIFFNKIARDALCIVTNRANPVANFSEQTIQAIFSGQVRDWGQVPGSRTSGPIDLNVRAPSSGTQDAFEKIFMGDAEVAGGAASRNSNGLVQASVRRNRNAIGYVSLNFTNGLSAARYQGTSCTLRSAKSGEYAGTRNFWLVTRGRARGPIRTFIRWTQANRRARAIIANGYVPLR